MSGPECTRQPFVELYERGQYRSDDRSVNRDGAALVITADGRDVLVVEGDPADDRGNVERFAAIVDEAVHGEPHTRPLNMALVDVLDTLQGQRDSLGYFQHLTYREAVALARLAGVLGEGLLARDLMLRWAEGDDDAAEWSRELSAEWGIRWERHDDGDGEWIAAGVSP